MFCRTARRRSRAGEANNEATNLLSRAHRQISDLLRDLPTSAQSRAHGVIGALRRAIEQEWADAFDSVKWRSTQRQSAPCILYRRRRQKRSIMRRAKRSGIPNVTVGSRARAQTGIEHFRALSCWTRFIIEDDGSGECSSIRSAERAWTRFAQRDVGRVGERCRSIKSKAAAHDNPILAAYRFFDGQRQHAPS